MKALQRDWQFWTLAVTILVLAGTQIHRNGVHAAQLQRVIEDQAMTQTATQKLTSEISRLNGNVEHLNGYIEAGKVR